MTTLVERLRYLSKVRWDQEAWERETTVRIPAEPERDIDLVLARAADEIARLTAELERWRNITARKDPDDCGKGIEELWGRWKKAETEVEALRAICPITREVWADSLNQRATVEQELLDASKNAMPTTPEQLRKWAMKLGVPDNWREFGRKHQAEVDALRALLKQVKVSDYDPGPCLIADIDAALKETT